LLAGLYWQRQASRGRDTEQRQQRRALAERLLRAAWSAAGALGRLAEAQRAEVARVAAEAVALFVRSSSCVEGRNGRLSLHHHGQGRLGERKLKALTVLHNYGVKRPDGTTAAQRFFGVEHPDCASKMASLGRAFQRTNIVRDIDEDHEHGRLYIASSTIERFGFPSPGKREALLLDQIARADALYEQGLGAIALLSRGRRGMALSAALYREILRQIEREGYGRNRGRVLVPGWRRRLLIAKHRLSPNPSPRHAAALL